MTIKEIIDEILRDSKAGTVAELGRRAHVKPDLIRKLYKGRNKKMSRLVAQGLHNNLGYDWNWLMTGKGELKKAPIDKQTEIFDEKFSSKDDNHNLGVINQTPNDLKDMLTRALKDIGRLEHEIDLIKRELEALKSPKKVKESGEGGVIGDKDVV